MNRRDAWIPDSPLARDASRLVRDVSPAFLYQHALRTYAFGDALGRRDGLRYDRELLYLGAVMHDLGLTKRFEGGAPFELNGADAALRFLLAHGYPPDKAAIVHEAIALHLVAAAEQKQPEVALVRLGAGMDVTGSRLEDLPQTTVHEILEAYPRLGFKRAFLAVVTDQAHRTPTSTIAKLVRSGTADRVSQEPFAE